MMDNLQNKKKEILEQIGYEGLTKIKFSKFLKLIKLQIQDLINYYSIKQAHQIINEVFELNISAPLFYRFCAKNLKKDEKSEPIKKDKKLDVGVSQKRDTKISSLEDLIGK